MVAARRPLSHLPMRSSSTIGSGWSNFIGKSQALAIQSQAIDIVGGPGRIRNCNQTVTSEAIDQRDRDKSDT
jgi:hypothetical protein